MRTTTTLTLLSLLTLTLAKTDLSGCTSSAVVVDGARYVQWWVPETGEICSGLDCGGGRGPLKFDVPGCPAYTGTLKYEPSYLPGGGPNGFVQAPATPTADVEGPEATPVVIKGGPTLGGGAGGAGANPPVETSGPSTGEDEESGLGSGSGTGSGSDDEEADAGAPAITPAPQAQTGFQTTTREGTATESSSDEEEDEEDDNKSGSRTVTGGVSTGTSEGFAAQATWPSVLTPVMGVLAAVAAVAV